MSKCQFNADDQIERLQDGHSICDISEVPRQISNQRSKAPKVQVGFLGIDLQRV